MVISVNFKGYLIEGNFSQTQFHFPHRILEVLGLFGMCFHILIYFFLVDLVAFCHFWVYCLENPCVISLAIGPQDLLINLYCLLSLTLQGLDKGNIVEKIEAIGSELRGFNEHFFDEFTFGWGIFMGKVAMLHVFEEILMPEQVHGIVDDIVNLFLVLIYLCLKHFYIFGCYSTDIWIK